ncbi:MAG: hypothetical protein ACQEWM_03170 [Actinomycetota bacterium]
MARTRLRTAAALGLVALLAGCAAPAAVPSDTPSASDSAPADPTLMPSATPDPTPAADPMADWQLIQPQSGRTQFRIPADWSADVTFAEVDGEPADGVVVRRPDGQAQLRFSQVPGDVGGSCGERPQSEVLDMQSLSLDADEPTAFGAVAAELQDGRWIFGMGVTAERQLQEPLGCPFYFITGGPAEAVEPSGLLTFATESQLSGTGDAAVWIVDSLDDARAYLETEEYATLKQILLSLEYRI